MMLLVFFSFSFSFFFWGRGFYWARGVHVAADKATNLVFKTKQNHHFQQED